ncbi:MAG: hypothetical protein ACTSPI_02520 [Candidatus Heimdallarchaeaceae archaeon]
MGSTELQEHLREYKKNVFVTKNNRRFWELTIYVLSLLLILISILLVITIPDDWGYLLIMNFSGCIFLFSNWQVSKNNKSIDRFWYMQIRATESFYINKMVALLEETETIVDEVEVLKSLLPDKYGDYMTK